MNSTINKPMFDFDDKHTSIVLNNAVVKIALMHQCYFQKRRVYNKMECLVSKFNPISIKLKDMNVPHERSGIQLFNVLSKRECSLLMKKIDEGNLVAATIITGDRRELVNQEIRNCKRYIFDDQEFAYALWGRIKSIIGLRPVLDGTSVWKPTGINKLFRALVYGPGEFFKAHYDMPYIESSYAMTFKTIMIYLNVPKKGGNTNIFYDDEPNRKIGSVTPTQGMLFVFDHDIFHDGEIVTKGVKYAIRTDIIYTRNP